MRFALLASTGVTGLAVFLVAAPLGAVGQEALQRPAEPGGVDHLILIQASVAVGRSHPEQDSRQGHGNVAIQGVHGDVPRIVSGESVQYFVGLSKPMPAQGNRGVLVGAVVGVCIVILFLCSLGVYVWSPDGVFDKEKAIYCHAEDFAVDAPDDVPEQAYAPEQISSSPGPKSPPGPDLNNAPASIRTNTVPSEGNQPGQIVKDRKASAQREQTVSRLAEEVSEGERGRKAAEDGCIAADAKRLCNRVEEHMRALTPPRKTSGTVSSFSSPSTAAQVPWETLPPICPSLILSDCEARCAIAVQTLKLSTPVQLDVIGLSGNQLFRADVQRVGKDKDDLMLNVSLAHLGSIPRVTVLPPTGMGMQINGPGGSLYGWLKLGEGGFWEVVKDDQPRLVISGDLAALSLEMRASSDQQIRATASRSLEYIAGEEHLEFRVQPGFDMVLIVSCVLAVLLIAPPVES
mmetsp:Transcript_52846/g.113229  ORF Transcript_52846/g.113229 Transcript_52846/m.113229 type:complete len:461 (-) Transcript_52846:22-1404(-)